MADKTFVVSHAHARHPLTITGKSLEDALAKEGLDPSIWKESRPAPESEVAPGGEDQGNARSGDH